MAKNPRWWTEDSSEIYWLEATDREDIGDDLCAPLKDEGGKDNPRYTLFLEANIGDIVFHYDKGISPSAIVGYSKVADEWYPESIVWGARGSYAREKGVRPYRRPGYVLPLEDYTELDHPVTLDSIRAVELPLKELIAHLTKKHNGQPLYFPFELSNKRPIRPLQGYCFKLPKDFLKLFDPLAKVIGPPTSLVATKPTYADFGNAPNDDPNELQQFAAKVRRGQTEFRKILLDAYGYRCALTGHGPSYVLEAVHIVSHAETGINELDNGLLMRADLHCLFDVGLININPDDFTVVVDANLMDTPYWELNGQMLRTRVNGNQIASKYLRERWED